ncbi:YidB family protein, partial [Salmonella enterica]|uniref:YidB family protein n=1 Tax=Salmonella enterica TaxID=28901 RepID=UPI0022B6B053|nr:YidB family protein [Salmonella enterica]
QRGLSQQANSWVGTGHNEQVTPHQLADALGDDTVQELQQQTGMPREALLAELARELPEAIHQATPSGQLPNDEDLHRLARG